MATASRNLLIATCKEYVPLFSAYNHQESNHADYSLPENTATLRSYALLTYTRSTRTSCAHAQNSSLVPLSSEERYVSGLIIDKDGDWGICIILTLRKEATEGGVDLSADDASIVKLLVQYLYEAEYDPFLSTFTASANTGNRNSQQTAPHTCPGEANRDEWGNRGQCSWICPHHHCGRQCDYTCADFICTQCITVEGDPSQLILHTQMYEMADRYDVVGLKALSIEKFRRACMRFWDHPEFAQAAYHAYTTTPDDDKGLRSVVYETLSKHMSLLLKPEVEGLMVEFNGLSFDLLMAKAKQAGWCNK